MTNFEIIGLYVALNILLAAVLMLRVGQARVKGKVSLGDGDDFTLLTRIRAHGNFTESVPLVLIGLIALAQLGATAMVLHIFGGVYTVVRVAHAHGLAQEGGNGKGRVIGALGTLLVLLGIALVLLYKIFLA